MSPLHGAARALRDSLPLLAPEVAERAAVWTALLAAAPRAMAPEGVALFCGVAQEKARAHLQALANEGRVTVASSADGPRYYATIADGVVAAEAGARWLLLLPPTPPAAAPSPEAQAGGCSVCGQPRRDCYCGGWARGAER